MAEFDVKTISCTSKITVKIEVNIGSLEHEYDGNELDFGKIFTIDSGKGTNYTAKLRIHDFGQPMQVQYASGEWSEFHQKGFGLTIADVQKVDLDINIAFSETIFEKFSGSDSMGKAFFFHGCKERYGCGIHLNLDDFITGKFKSFKGEITIDFEPGSQMIYKEKFKNYVNSHLVFKPDGNEEDFQIVCQGKSYGFNKSILCNISPVFERMLTNPSFKQCQEGLTEIKDTTPETIKAFHNILTLDYIEKENFSIALFMFADKYDIPPLYKLCQDYFCTAISKDNLFDVIKAANYTKDDELMSKAAEFIKRMNTGTFDIGENPEWNTFCKENPECAIKILNFMMFKKK